MTSSVNGRNLSSLGKRLRSLSSPLPARSVNLRTLSRFLLVVIVSLLVPSRLSVAQSTPPTPIKVRGGSTTFFSEQPWILDARKTKPTYCAAIKASDLSSLELENFFPVTIQDFRRRKVTEISVPLTTETWRIEIFGHHEKETAGALQLSTDGIALQASPKSCAGAETSASVRIAPLGKASFYPRPDLIPAGIYSSNKRFLSKCSSLRRDRCERIAEIHVFDGDPRKPRVFTCPDGECTIYIGKPEDEGHGPQ